MGVDHWVHAGEKAEEAVTERADDASRNSKRLLGHYYRANSALARAERTKGDERAREVVDAEVRLHKAKVLVEPRVSQE
jgi:hypothetical protein